MHETDSTSSDMVQLVRSALAHLYDQAYMQNHPLATALDTDGALDGITRAQRLRRLLLNCIDELGPQARKKVTPDAMRACAILSHHYVDGLSMSEIAGTLALSERQAYREHRKGVEAIASMVDERLGSNVRKTLSLDAADHSAAGASTDVVSMAQTEVRRFHHCARPDLLNLTEVLQGVLDTILPRCHEMEIDVTSHAADSSCVVMADRALLRQALLNLLGHALLYADRGELRITVRAESQVLQVEALAGEELSTPPHLPAPQTAHGVQLAVATSLCECQGGRIETGMDGRTWQARVYMPAPGKSTVLAIDDNADIVALFQRYLAGQDISVVGATIAEQAPQVAADLQPQVITLDVMMPGQDGWEILQTLKRNPKTQAIPVIVCSVLPEFHMARSIGASDYIQKPVNQDDLRAVIHRWLGHLSSVAPAE